jgi:DNA polymerase I-like protein with 3'-5' exonuclease and polymerase domains
MSNDFPNVTPILVDARNYASLLPSILQRVSAAEIIGIDIETEDSRRHSGLQAMIDAGKTVFDVNRTTLCGLSLYVEGSECVFYFNTGHADAANRLRWVDVEAVLNARSETAYFVCHNTVFERTMLEQTVGYVLTRYICTLQMAVSSYNPDEYDIAKFRDKGLGAMATLIPEIVRVSRSMTETSEMQEVLSKIIAKESDAAHSYNGYIKDIAYGYGLKQAVMSFFGYKMTTFKEVLGTRAHMGELTGEEVVAYAGDDSVWCVRLFRRLLAFMMETNPAVVETFFKQELPMIEVYSETWRHGIKIDADAVAAREADNRVRYAEVVRKLRHAMKALLPFPAEPHAYLEANEKWYAKNGPKYRAMIEQWCALPDAGNDFAEAYRVRGPIPNAWAEALGAQENFNALNLSYYMTTRVIIYDLFRVDDPIVEQGKVQSDAWARGRLKERLTRKGFKAQADVIGLLGEVATVEQAQKLYLTPYQKLVDPESAKLHPQLTSVLATRRTAMSQPNAQQLAKRGDTVYVRDFYEADDEDSVIVSLDLSQIELVTIAEFSRDPEFLRCYANIPYDDLHVIAASGCLSVEESELRALQRGVANGPPHLLVDPRGEVMKPKDAYKVWRTLLGKNTNFEFWYSGLLKNTAEKMGWSREEMFEMGDRYKARFAVAEEWRLGTISDVREHGFVTLPDHHRRVRYEATASWAQEFRSKWSKYDSPEINWFVDKVIRRTQSRAGNQAVNGLVQGTCATIVKRSILSIRDECKRRAWSTKMARFMMPIHDEVVYSVNREIVSEFIGITAAALKAHTDIFKHVVLDSSPSVGLTFAPWHPTKARLGQVELYEAPEIEPVPAEFVGKRLPEEHWPAVVDWLFAERERMRAK